MHSYFLIWDVIDASSIEIHVKSGDVLGNAYMKRIEGLFRKTVVSGGKTVYQKMLNKKDGFQEKK